MVLLKLILSNISGQYLYNIHGKIVGTYLIVYTINIINLV